MQRVSQQSKIKGNWNKLNQLDISVNAVKKHPQTMVADKKLLRQLLYLFVNIIVRVNRESRSKIASIALLVFVDKFFVYQNSFSS